MGGAGGLGGLLNITQEANTGKDPTAKKFGNTPEVTVNTGNLLPNPMGGTVPVNLPQKQKNLESKSAQNILDTFDSQNEQIAKDFGQNKITDFNIYVEPGTSKSYGGSHPSPKTGETKHYEDNITLNINTAPPSSGKPSHGGPSEAVGLTDAEVVESYEDRTKNWNAGQTSGEALSRALSFSLQPNTAQDPNLSRKPMQEWWKNGHKDYINGNPDFSKNEPVANGLQLDHWGGMQSKTQASDHNPNSNGSGTLFLNYMHDKLGYSWDQITSAKGNTLGEKYQSLTGKSGKQGFQNFLQALPTKTLANGQTVLNLPPDGNPFQNQN